MKHGCHRCGSIPVSPNGNALEGRIKIDFTWGACETGICGQRAIDAPGKIYKFVNVDTTTTNEGMASRSNSIMYKSSSEDAATVVRSVSDQSMDYASNTSPLDVDPTGGDTSLGINCRGSGNCNTVCRRNIFQLADYIYKISKRRSYSAHYTLSDCRADSDDRQQESISQRSADCLRWL
jgi:ferredoxin